jgi:hypothetical protein
MQVPIDSWSKEEKTNSGHCSILISSAEPIH